MPRLTALLFVAIAGCTRTMYSTGEVAPAAAIDWKAVEAAIGRSGATQPGDVYRFNFPRSDLRVMVGDVQVPGPPGARPRRVGGLQGSARGRNDRG
jgi:hypothetical protein